VQAPIDLRPTVTDDRLGDIPLTDAELTDLALAADPDAPLGADAVPFDLYLGRMPELLPMWYMPRAMGRGARWRTVVVVVLIAAFLLIDAAGLCSTYGHITIA
jgi:hypothetical protein